MRRFTSISRIRARTPAHALSCWVVVALLAMTAPEGATAQQPGALSLQNVGNVADRIVAVVGDSIILQTEVRERFLELQQQGVTIPQDPEALADLERQLVETMVSEHLLVQAALEDTTIVVDDQRVEETVSQDIDRRVQDFGSQQALRQALDQAGMTLTSYRERLRGQVQRQLLIQEYQSRRRQTATTIPITEAEVREFFEANQSLIGERPPDIRFEQVVIEPEPTEEAVARARAEAEAILDSLRTGQADFEALARAHSDDPGSAAQGGSLGWFRRDIMVPEFEDAVFGLREGQISDIVETNFGFHIIRVDRIRGSERRARHILISPEIGPADLEAARAAALDVLERVRSGTPIDSLQEEHGTQPAVGSVTIERQRLTSLPPAYLDPLRNAQSGDLIGPLEWQSQGQTNYAVVEVVEVREGGAFTLEEVEPQIRQQLQQEKFLDQLVSELRESTYVDIRL